MERWTRLVLRFRWPILVGWLVVLLAGAFAFTRLSSLLSNEFSVPGTDSERARTILEHHFGDRSDGAFTVVFRVRDTLGRDVRAPAARSRPRRASRPGCEAARVGAGRSPHPLRRRRLEAEAREGEGVHGRSLPGAAAHRRRRVVRD